MSSASPLVFRPSLAQRSIAVLLCAGSLMMGIRGIVLLIQGLPHLLWSIRVASASHESPYMLWILVGLSVAACLLGGILVLLAVLGMLLIEGCHVLVDDLGIAVVCETLPAPVARRFGAGRLSWKQVRDVQKHQFFFVLTGDPLVEQEGAQLIRLKFLMVDELERLMHTICERSPNLDHHS